MEQKALKKTGPEAMKQGRHSKDRYEEITMATPHVFVRGGRAVSSRAGCSIRSNVNLSSQLENT